MTQRPMNFAGPVEKRPLPTLWVKGSNPARSEASWGTDTTNLLASQLRPQAMCIWERGGGVNKKSLCHNTPNYIPLYSRFEYKVHKVCYTYKVWSNDIFTFVYSCCAFNIRTSFSSSSIKPLKPQFYGFNYYCIWWCKLFQSLNFVSEWKSLTLMIL